MTVSLSNPVILHYNEFRGDMRVPVVHLFANGENGDLYTRSSDIQPDGNIGGTWTSLGPTPSGAKMLAGKSAGTVTYIDPSGVRQAHAFVWGADFRLNALSLGFTGWQWRSLPSPPSSAVHVKSSPAVIAYLFEQNFFNIAAFTAINSLPGPPDLSELLAYSFEGINEKETWIEFGLAKSSTPITVGAAVYSIADEQQVYALTELFEPLFGDGQHQFLELLSWDGGSSSNSVHTVSKLTQGQNPRNLDATALAVTTCFLPLGGVERTVAFSWNGGDSPGLFGCVSDNGTDWNWHDLGNDQSGRSLAASSLGAFSYVRVLRSPTALHFVPILIAALRYTDNSLALNMWDGEHAPTWVNLGVPPGGGAGCPCGAGFYTGQDPNAVETVLVLIQNSEGRIFVNKTGPFGRQWLDLGLPDQ